MSEKSSIICAVSKFPHSVVTMELLRLFFENDKLDGSVNHMTWTIVVKNFLKRDELFDELNFGVKPDANGTFINGGISLMAQIRRRRRSALLQSLLPKSSLSSY